MGHQLEFLYPHQLKRILSQTPWVFIPVGAIEWHGHHTVVGLDGVKAHRQLLRVADVVGGVVYPPIYTGHYTGDQKASFTYMVSQSSLYHILKDILCGLEKDGFQKAVILNGHYPNHIFIGYELMREWKNENHSMELLSIRESNLEGISGDHAGKDETSMMLDLNPDCVDLSRIQTDGERVALEEKGNWLEEDDSHPLSGVLGVHPLSSTSEYGNALNRRLVNAISGWIKKGEITLKYEK